MVGDRLPAGHELHPGVHQRRRLRRDVRGGDRGTAPRSSPRSCSTRGSIATCGRSSCRPTPSSAASSIAIRGSTQIWTGDQRRRLVRGRQGRICCRSGEQQPGGAGGARRGEDADRRRGGRERARGRRTSSSTSSAARTSRRWWKCRGMPATSGAASRTGSRRRAAAFRWGGGRGLPDAEPGADLHRAERRWCVSDDVASRTVSLVGRDGTVAPLLAEHGEPDAGAHRPQLSARGGGFFIGTGLAWSLPKEGRLEAFSEDNDSPFGDYWDWQVRIGLSPGRAGVCAAAAARRRRRRPRRRRVVAQPDGRGGVQSAARWKSGSRRR